MTMSLTNRFERLLHETQVDLDAEIAKNRTGEVRFRFQDADGAPVRVDRVEIVLKRHEFLFGCGAFSFSEFEGEELKTIEETHGEFFNLLVTPFLWGDLEPEEGKPRYGMDAPYRYRRPAPDSVLRFAEAHDMRVKAHTLMTHLSIPEWFPRDLAAARECALAHYAELSERYGRRVAFWDAVNEPLMHPYLRKGKGPFFQEGYTEWNFREIGKFFPEAKIFANENFHPAKFFYDDSPFYLLLRRLLDSGCRIDGAGLFYHLNPSAEGLEREFHELFDPRELFSRLDLYGLLGLPLHLSELSVPVCSGDETLQVLMARQLYRTFFAHPAVEAIVWWNPVAGLVQQGEEKLDSGFLRRDLSKRPAFETLREMITREWTTHVTADGCGSEYRFKGYYGSYDVTIMTHDGVRHRLSFRHQKNNPPKIAELTVSA